MQRTIDVCVQRQKGKQKKGLWLLRFLEIMSVYEIALCCVGILRGGHCEDYVVGGVVGNLRSFLIIAGLARDRLILIIQIEDWIMILNNTILYIHFILIGATYFK